MEMKKENVKRPDKQAEKEDEKTKKLMSNVKERTEIRRLCEEVG